MEQKYSLNEKTVIKNHVCSLWSGGIERQHGNTVVLMRDEISRAANMKKYEDLVGATTEYSAGETTKYTARGTAEYTAGGMAECTAGEMPKYSTVETVK